MFNASSAATRPPSRQAVDNIPGLFMPIYPSQGNFVIIECARARLQPEALAAVFAQRGIMIRQGSYHTPALRLALRQGQHHGAERMGGRVLPRIARRDRCRARRSTISRSCSDEVR